MIVKLSHPYYIMSDKKSEIEESNETSNNLFVNPIDADKVVENPGLIDFAHTVGGAVITKTDPKGIKHAALRAMYEQTDMQLTQIQEQIELLARQAKALQDRRQLSEIVYQAKLSFKPLIGHTYYLYERENGDFLVSMVASTAWPSGMPFKQFHGAVKLLADHTWDISESNE